MKEKTIKWLGWQMDEINNNLLAMKMSEEDVRLNKKDIEELSQCIKWVKSRK